MQEFGLKSDHNLFFLVSFSSFSPSFLIGQRRQLLMQKKRQESRVLVRDESEAHQASIFFGFDWESLSVFCPFGIRHIIRT